jgi:hypothetical protein
MTMGNQNCEVNTYMELTPTHTQETLFVSQNLPTWCQYETIATEKNLTDNQSLLQGEKNKNKTNSV